MAVPTYVATSGYAGGSGGSSLVYNKPAGTAEGDIIIVALYKESSATVTPASGFVAVDTPAAITSGSTQWHYLYWKRAGSSEPSTYTFSWSGAAYRAGQAITIRGCAATGDPWDVYDKDVKTSTSGGNTPNVSVTTTGADRLLLWSGTCWNTGSWTAPSGFTIRGSNSGILQCFATRDWPTAGATGDVSGTDSAANSTTAWLIALKPEADEPPADPPGAVFDLSNWKWTGPIDDPNDPGDAIEIQQPELDTYSSDYFELDSSDRLVFTAPVQGVTTSGSGGTRSELREMENGTEAAWTPFDEGVRQLTVTERVDPTGLTDRQEMIIGQIHAGANPAVYLAAEWESSGNPVTPRLRVFKDRNDGSGSSTGVGNMLSGDLDTDVDFTWRIRVENEQVIVSAAVGGPENLPASGTTNRFVFDATADFDDDQGWYFKAGAYNKSEVVDGGTGSAIATVSFIELIQGDENEPTTYDRAGSAAAVAAGSGTLEVVEPATYDRTGTAAAVAAGSGAVAVQAPAVYDRTGAAGAVAAGSGAVEHVLATRHDRTGGAAAVAAGVGSIELDEPTTFDRAGAAAAVAAGVGSVAVQSAMTYDRAGSAAAVAAGVGAVALDEPTTYDRTGAAAAVAAGSGTADVDTVNVYDRAGSGAAVAAGSGARQRTHARAGAAGAVAAGSGAAEVASAAVYERTGAGAAVAAGSGTGALKAPGEHEVAGGAAAVAAGSGAVEVAHPTTYDRSGAAAALAAGAGSKQLVRSLTGGAAAVAAGSGSVELVGPTTYDRAGGAAAVVAGAGSGTLLAVTIYERSGSAAAVAAGSGSVAVAEPDVHKRAGGAAAVAAGIGLVEVIHPTTYDRAGAGAALVAGSGFWRIGGAFHVGRPYRRNALHAGVPVTVGRQHAGIPYAVGQHHAGPETVT